MKRYLFFFPLPFFLLVFASCVPAQTIRKVGNATGNDTAKIQAAINSCAEVVETGDGSCDNSERAFYLENSSLDNNFEKYIDKILAFFDFKNLFNKAKIFALGVLNKSQIEIVNAQGSGNSYYISPSGNDSNSGSISSPWKSVGKGWSTAQSGDTVYFREGTYTLSSTIISSKDGTASNPITFKNYSNENVVIDGNGLEEMFNHERDYYIIEGINFRNGITAFRVAEDTTATGNIFRNNTWTTSLGGDNVGFVKLSSRAAGTVVEGNILVGPGEGAHANTAGIYLQRLSDVTIINNEISNVPIGIYYKHANSNAPSNIEIAYNYIHDTSRYSIFTNSNYAKIHNNLIGNNNVRMRVNESNGVPGGDNNEIFHNTFIGGYVQFNCDENGALNNRMENNIFLERLDLHRYCSTNHNTSMDYNLYPSGNMVIEDRQEYSLGSWLSHSGEDANSISGAPLFNSDFSLQSGSIGKNSASDGKDMGADISLVGPGGTYVPPPPTTPVKTPTPTPTKAPIKGDMDGDGDVDIFDYNVLIGNFGNTNCGNAADIDGNCKVDIFDYNILVENFGK